VVYDRDPLIFFDLFTLDDAQSRRSAHPTTRRGLWRIPYVTS
jgi:hypothetical protein